MDWFWSTGPFWFALFCVSMFFNARASFKLLLDWKGMVTTCRFIEDAYAGVDRLPTEAELEHEPLHAALEEVRFVPGSHLQVAQLRADYAGARLFAGVRESRQDRGDRPREYREADRRRATTAPDPPTLLSVCSSTRPGTR